jgi:hypothetical protein
MVHREGFEPPRPTWGDRVTAGPFLPGSRTCANLGGLRWESSDVPTLSVLQLQTWPYALRLPNVLSVQTLCCLGGVPSIRCQSGISMGDGLLRHDTLFKETHPTRHLRRVCIPPRLYAQPSRLQPERRYRETARRTLVGVAPTGEMSRRSLPTHSQCYHDLPTMSRKIL